MTTRPHRLRDRWCPRALAVVLAAAALLVAAATAAQAHNVLVSTSPADGATAKVVPAQVTLTFNEPVIAVGTEIIVTGPDGPVQTGAAVLVNSTVTEHLQPGSPAGQYNVVWRVTSADGHPVSGRFLFNAAAPSSGQSASATAASNPSNSTPAGGSGQSFVMWFVLAGIVLILLLLAAFIRTRTPRTTPHHERDPES
jgi:methionine-rich copper-binding protein CopC